LLLEKDSSGLMPAELCTAQARGVAAGDGANGALWLMVNETLTGRNATSQVRTLPDERKLIESKQLTVRLTGATGVVGAHCSEGFEGENRRVP